MEPVVAPLVSLFWRLSPWLSAFLPRTVRGILSAASRRKELIELVTQVSRYANLSNEERRKRALQVVGTWLRSRGIDLSDHELALLVELLYGWVKRHRKSAIVPPPVPFGRA
jgi:hypothetical protein